MFKTATTAAFAALLFSSVTAMAGPTPEQKCEAGKNEAAGRYDACAAKAEKGLVSTGDMVKYADALVKCEGKLVDKWTKLEADAVADGAVCPSTGDQVAIQNFVDACVQSVAVAVGGGTLGPDPVTCASDLTTCDGDLTTCDGSLTTCTSELGTCNSDLSVCNTDNSLCFDGWLGCIDDQIVANAGTATPGDVLVGRTFTSASGLASTGTVPAGTNLGAEGILGGTLPAGLYNGTTTFLLTDAQLVAGNVRSGVDIFGVVGDSNVVDTSSGDAVAADLAAGKIAWVDGAPVTGASTPGSCGNGIVDGGDQCELGDLDGATCATQGFTGGILTCGAGCQFDVSGCSSGRFEDTGLTVLDHWTGLEWVKTNDDGGLTDKDTLYTWSSGAGGPDSGRAMTGNVFTVYLQGLNSGNYAGRRGWRLPTLEELQTIVDMSAAGCGSGSPCINVSLFGPTQSNRYWSSSTYQGGTTDASFVFFGAGGTSSVIKTESYCVRGVRAGS